jgi:hypothetical protein
MKKRIRFVGLLLGILIALPAFAQRESSDSSPEAAGRALKNFEECFNATPYSSDKFYVLTMIAPTAYTAGDLEKAKSYSNALLSMAADFPGNWNYGNAIHVGNLVLGRVALASGDVASAKIYLLEAGKTIGSPQLNSFGPNMTLARELVEKGEREVVLEYFNLCAKFWKMPGERLEKWALLVKDGKTPNFGANLRYGTAFPVVGHPTLCSRIDTTKKN